MRTVFSGHLLENRPRRIDGVAHRIVNIHPVPGKNTAREIDHDRTVQICKLDANVIVRKDTVRENIIKG